jgi:UDP-N-acetylglucosamine 2-epimerase
MRVHFDEFRGGFRRTGDPVRSRVPCACVVGTRPEVIKTAPVIRRLQQSGWAQPLIIAQQDDLLAKALAALELRLLNNVGAVV